MNSDKSVLVVGAGFVGLATATFLACKGFRVRVVDRSEVVVESLQRGILHFHETGLSRHFSTVFGRRLTVALPEASDFHYADFIYIAIDSAYAHNGRMKSGAFERLADWIGEKKRRARPTVVLKSTNRIGFASEFRKLLDATPHGKSVRLVVNPEFLREGFAYEDTAHPWRVVIGGKDRSQCQPLISLYKQVYPPSIPVIVTDSQSAELIKLASNIYLAHRLTFVNEVTECARTYSMDSPTIIKAIGLDRRIGLDYFEPGLGFGGSCLPKDCKLINSRENDRGYTFRTAKTALSVNRALLDSVVGRLKSRLGNLKDKKIAILGLAFKPEVDDTRGSQAVALALKLKRCGVRLGLYDPYLSQVRKVGEGRLTLVPELNAVLEGASALIIGTAHQKFRSLRADIVSKKVKQRIVIDQFSVLNRAAWSKKRFEFI